MINQNLLNLIDLLIQSYDRPKKKDGYSYITNIVREMGHYQMPVMRTPERIISKLDNDKSFIKSDSHRYAAISCNSGDLVLAALNIPKCTHVCCVRPGQTVYSIKWDTRVPKVVSIKTPENKSICDSVDMVFPTLPTYYIYRGETK